MDQLEDRIEEWRSFVGNRTGVDRRDADELEAHLRDQIADLDAAGLTPDEAFLIAVRRIGALDAVSGEYAREHTGRLWKQLVLSEDDVGDRRGRRFAMVVAFAVAAAVAVQTARFAGGGPGKESRWVFRNAVLLVLPFLAGYFAAQRRLDERRCVLAALPIVIGAAVINLYPFTAEGPTELLAIGHLPVVLWSVVAYAYSGASLSSSDKRMDFVRFTGEWIIYFALIAIGGGVLMGLTAGVLQPAGIDAQRVIAWVVPPGAAGAVLVAAWLVESKQHVVENMAPVLTMVFTPLFAVMLLVSAVVYAATGLGREFDREVLTVFDLLLVTVLGLVLYGTSAREPTSRAGWMDRLQLVAVASALLLDAIVLAAMLGRIGDVGFTPNRTAALGLNLLLLVNLAGTAWHSVRFLRGRSVYHRLERWQMSYLPLFAVWAAVVVVVLPIVFDFA